MLLIFWVWRLYVIPILIILFLVCPVELTPSSRDCRNARFQDIVRARMWYKLAGSNSTNVFPLARHIPWLDHSIPELQYYYSIDPYESRFMILLGTWLRAGKAGIARKLLPVFGSKPFVSSEEYVALYQSWNNAVAVSFIHTLCEKMCIL